MVGEVGMAETLKWESGGQETSLEGGGRCIYTPQALAQSARSGPPRLALPVIWRRREAREGSESRQGEAKAG